MPKSQYHDIQKRIDMDLLSRSTFALFVYCAIFPVILYPFGLFESHPAMSWGISIASVCVSLIRFTHLKLADRFYERSPVLWMAIFKACSMSHAMILSTLFVLVTYHPDFTPAYAATLLTAAGISSGGISSLSPNLFMAIVFPVILLLPTIAVNFYLDGTRALGWLMALYLGYLCALARRTNIEYMRTFAIEEQLERQKKELETLSRTDALTGIYNRGYFNSLYDMIWDSSVRNNIGITLMMMDVDHFKHVNDTYGHVSGDECLKMVADSLKECLKRKTDISCRFGGEEFAVLISGTPIHEAEKLAENIRKCIASRRVENGEHRFKVTISIGLANILPKLGDKPIRLVEQADQALYRAKKSGRNCVRTFHMN
ncbi:putative diguanylate cyclase AdrA [Thalassocella blandensis]|nr:putative diguanylate cyclase AdrA [Thalassocella blandensis]